MKSQDLTSLPNSGYFTTAGIYGCFNDHILVGGGSGFKTPLADGGTKLLNESIRLLNYEKDQWQILAEIKVMRHERPYGFCNGANLVFENKAYFFGGLKLNGTKVLNSSDAVVVTVTDEKQIKVHVFRNALPFEGEVSGVVNQAGKGYLLAGEKLLGLQLTSDDLKPFVLGTLQNHDVSLNGSLMVSLDNQNQFAFIGGYRPFISGDSTTNIFDLTKIVKYDGTSFKQETLTNLVGNPLAFLGATAIYHENQKALIFGGVDPKLFVNAIHNLSTLEGDALAAYKKQYFAMSETDFKFNRQLATIDFNKNEVQTLGEIPVGLAGNPAVVKWRDGILILSGEVKAGVRMEHPIYVTW